MCSVAFDKAPRIAPPNKPQGTAAIASMQAKEMRERDKHEIQFGTALTIWLDKYARMRRQQIERRLKSKGLKSGLDITKAKVTFSSLERELQELYMQFGLQQVEESAHRWSASLGTRFVLRPQVKERYARTVENKVVLLFQRTETMVRQSLQNIIVQALSETPRPTVADVTRRISRQWHGPFVQTGVDQDSQPVLGRATEAERLSTAAWQRRRRDLSLPPGPGVYLPEDLIEPGEREALFSPARARAIARTELGDADTAGALEGFKAADVEKAGWLARPNDGRSGKRQHYKMNNHPPVKVVDLVKSNRRYWFKLPSGDRARRPLDPVLPAGQRVNCRCILVPRR